MLLCPSLLPLHPRLKYCTVAASPALRCFAAKGQQQLLPKPREARRCHQAASASDGNQGHLPSGNSSHSYGKASMLLGKSPFIFNSYVKFPEGNPSPLRLSAPIEIRALYLMHLGIAAAKGNFPADQLVRLMRMIRIRRIHSMITIPIKIANWWLHQIFR